MLFFIDIPTSDRLARIRADDHAQVLRLLVKRHRDMAQLRAKQLVRLSALLTELQPGGTGSNITLNRAKGLLNELEVSDEVTRHRVITANELILTWSQFLHSQTAVACDFFTVDIVLRRYYVLFFIHVPTVGRRDVVL